MRRRSIVSALTIIIIIIASSAAASCGFSVTGIQQSDMVADGPETGASSSGETGEAGAKDVESPTAATDAGDGAPPRIGFCAAELPHEACLDFDDGKLDALGAPTIVLGGTIVVEGTRAVSLPNALHVSGSLLGSQAYIFKSWTKRSQVDVAFDVWAEGAGYGQIGGIEVLASNVTGSYQLLFTADDGQLGFVEVVNTFVINHPLVAGGKQSWHRLDVHLELVESATVKSRLRIREDRNTLFDGDLFLATTFITNVKADIGLNYSAKALPVNVYVDNATVDSRP
jgi:hypothetical protein